MPPSPPTDAVRIRGRKHADADVLTMPEALETLRWLALRVSAISYFAIKYTTAKRKVQLEGDRPVRMRAKSIGDHRAISKMVPNPGL